MSTDTHTRIENIFHGTGSPPIHGGKTLGAALCAPSFQQGSRKANLLKSSQCEEQSPHSSASFVIPYKEYGEDIWTRISAEINAGKLKLHALILHDMDDDDVPWQMGEALSRA